MAVHVAAHLHCLALQHQLVTTPNKGALVLAIKVDRFGGGLVLDDALAGEVHQDTLVMRDKLGFGLGLLFCESSLGEGANHVI